MKKIVFILLFLDLVFGKININEADRYELMTIGKLDAGRADMLINYRKNREITDANQLKLITGFGGYDTSVLEANFDIKEVEKKEIKEEKPSESQTIIQPVQVVEKTRVIHAPPRYKRVENYGDITITETGSIPPQNRRINRSHQIYSDKMQDRYFPQRPIRRPAPSKNNDCFRDGSNICISGEIEFGFQKRW